jgi:hypothetical protein
VGKPEGKRPLGNLSVDGGQSSGVEWWEGCVDWMDLAQIGAGGGRL